MTSILSAFAFIGEQSFATPGAFNSPLSILSANIAAVNAGAGAVSGATISPPSGNTITIASNLSVTGQVQTGGPLHVDGPLRLDVNSNLTNYLYLSDASNLRSDYIIGSQVGGTADGLNFWDDSGQTMLVSMSKQSIRFYQNVVGPVFDVGGALANTLNAATFGAGTDSIESRIQAAISTATASAVSRVYVPANMYPYSAASVVFSPNVQMVREGGNWSVYDILAYGAYGDGLHDDSAAVQGAINGASDGGLVYISAGTYLVSNLTSYGFANFQGSGRRGRLYNTTSGSTTLALTRHPSLTTYQNQEGNLDGISMRDVYFSSSRVTDIQALWLSRVDHSVFENLTFEAINGPAIHIAGMLRESQFYNTVTRWCGQSAQTGAIVLDDANSLSVEGTNEVKWYGTNVIYSFGPAIQIRTSASSYSNLNSKTRKIYFIGYQFHGSILYGPNFNGPAPQPDAALVHSLVTLGSCYDIYFIGGSLTAAGQAAAFFALQPGTSGVTASGATNVVIRDSTTGGHAAPSTGTVATFNSGVSIGQFCEVVMDNVHIDNSTRDVVAVSGSSLHLGLNVLLNGISSISSTAYEPPNRLTGVFAPRPGEQLIVTGVQRLQTQTLREDTGAGPLRIDGAQDNVTNSVIIRTTNGGGALTQTDRLYVGAGSSVTIHALSNTSIDGLLRVSGNVTSRGNVIAAGSSPFFRLGSAEDGSQGQLGFSGTDTFWDYLGKLNIRTITGGYGNVFTVNPSGVPASQVLFGLPLSIVTGSALAPGLAAGSEASLGLYRSGVSTLALSYGTLNLATQAVRLSMRTIAASALTASAANTNVAINETVFTVSASGASFAINSGGTTWIFNSDASAKNT